MTLYFEYTTLCLNSAELPEDWLAIPSLSKCLND
jgi:hypothetical protein